MRVRRIETQAETLLSEIRVGDVFVLPRPGYGYTYMKVACPDHGGALGVLELETGTVRKWKTDFMVKPIAVELQEKR